MGHHPNQLLPRGLAGGGEVLGEVRGQDDDQDVPQETAHPEVLGVHVQLVTVQLRQLGVGALEVVQVLDGLPKGGEHLLAVGTHLGVTDDGRGAGQVPEVREEPLGPGVDDQQPGERHRGKQMVKAPGLGRFPRMLPDFRERGRAAALNPFRMWSGTNLSNAATSASESAQFVQLSLAGTGCCLNVVEKNFWKCSFFLRRDRDTGRHHRQQRCGGSTGETPGRLEF
uniref:Uncharacterized protein n=1 Tax=Cyanistes caeruleus TaxID=156563 RepID=A0A8C0U5R9_CYACU